MELETTGQPQIPAPVPGGPLLPVPKNPARFWQGAFIVLCAIIAIVLTAIALKPEPAKPTGAFTAIKVPVTLEFGGGTMEVKVDTFRVNMVFRFVKTVDTALAVQSGWGVANRVPINMSEDAWIVYRQVR